MSGSRLTRPSTPRHLRHLLPGRGLSLDRLQSLLLVAEAGGIARAAPGNPVRQSQLSRQLGELEMAFGQPLTERRGGRATLTAFGRRVAEHARFTLEGLEELAAGATARPPAFSIGAGDALLHWLVIPHLPAIAARFRVSALAAEPLCRALEDGEIDLALLRGEQSPTGMIRRPLGRIAHVLFVPRGLMPRGVPLDRVVHEVPLALQTSDVDFRARLQRHGPIHVALSCETFPQAVRALATGAYAAVLPTLARQELGGQRGQYTEIAVGGQADQVHLAHAPRLLVARPQAEQVVGELYERLRRALATGTAGRQRG